MKQVFTAIVGLLFVFFGFSLWSIGHHVIPDQRPSSVSFLEVHAPVASAIWEMMPIPNNTYPL